MSSLRARTLVVVPGAILSALTSDRAALPQTVVTPRVTLTSALANDQDDMCVWVHPTDRSLSTVIASDKFGAKLFVYDLAGDTLQALVLDGEPGNVDIRHNCPLAGGQADLVAFNDRADSTIKVYRVDADTRRLERVDNGAIHTGRNYGFCLYRSPISGGIFAFSTVQNGVIQQYELHDDAGLVGGSLVRTWDIGGQTEGCVCDDETGFAYFAEEDVGIWKIGAEPTDPIDALLIASTVDSSGLTADVEGLTIYYRAGGLGYLIASSQGSNEFKVYERAAPHGYLQTFTIAGVTSTDGIDVCNVGLGLAFPSGMFASHDNTPVPKPVVLCAYEDLGLVVDTLYRRAMRDASPAGTALDLEGPGAKCNAWNSGCR